MGTQGVVQSSGGVLHEPLRCSGLTREGLFPTTLTRSTLLGGTSWIVSLSYFVGQAIAQLAWKGPPSYSMISNSVSDLGVTVCGTVKIGGLPGYYCSPLYLAENAGFVITGVAIFLGVCLTRDIWPRSKSSDAGLVLLALAGVGKVAAGLSPANVDLTIHLLDILGIILGNIGMIIVGKALRVEARRVARFTEALGVIGLIGILGFLVGSHSGFGSLLERIGGYPLIIWAAVIGITLIARRNVATTASTDNDTQSRLQHTFVRAPHATGHLGVAPVVEGQDHPVGALVTPVATHQLELFLRVHHKLLLLTTSIVYLVGPVRSEHLSEFISSLR